MSSPTLLLLTNDAEFEHCARAGADLSGYSIIVGRNPGDGARLLSQNLAGVTGVVIDMDDCKHGAAWLGALKSLSARTPAMAVSHLDPRFLQPLARRYGAEHWVSKPDSDGLRAAFKLASAFRSLCEGSAIRGQGQG